MRIIDELCDLIGETACAIHVITKRFPGQQEVLPQENARNTKLVDEEPRRPDAAAAMR